MIANGRPETTTLRAPSPPAEANSLDARFYAAAAINRLQKRCGSCALKGHAE
jgi:hypothetical protein